MRALALVSIAAGGIAGLVIAFSSGSSIIAPLVAAAALPVFVVLCGGVRRAFGISLAFVLFGYAAFGKGFSYLGAPPFYIGEVVVALALCVLLFVRPTRTRRSPAEVAIMALLVLGALLLIPGVGPFGIDALRDSVIFAYAVIALAVARSWTPTTGRVVQLTYERLAPFAVFLLVARPVGRLIDAEAFSGPRINGVNLFATKPGDVAVQLSVFLVYLVVLRGRGIAPWTRSPALRALFAQVAIVGLLVAIIGNRGGMVAAFCALLVGFVLSKRQVVFVVGGTVALALLLVVGPLVESDSADRRRSLSVEQIVDNVLSVITNDDPALSGTKEWRLRWWGDIIRTSGSTDRLLTGDGFGPNLAFVYGIHSSPDAPLRSPHNAVMTAFARGGLPFAALWLLAIGLSGRETLVARRLARRRRLPDARVIAARASVVLALIVATFVNGLFDVYLEGPAGGIWFWSACGAAIGIAGLTRPPRVPKGAPVAMTAAGAVAGSLHRAPDGTVLRRFLGIPYAAPPVGDLRWRAPQPPRPWTGTRPALEFAPAPPQGAALESRLPGFRPDHPTDEDCLALNVWTPGLHGARPVVVWFPGGAYLSGATAQPVYDAARMAAESNAVVVTVGYRLGALGFLDPEGDGVANCGLRDQLAALDWVQQHATAFGGNPTKVTVMGESAGAGSILHLLASPVVAAAPTFHGAVVQSGQPTTLTAAQGRAVADSLARHLGLRRADADALRAVPVDRLLEAQAATSAELLASIGPMAFAPVLDGEVCDGAIVERLAEGRASRIALVIGTTRDELALFSDPRDATMDDDRLARRLTRLFGDERAAARALAGVRRRLPPTATNADVWDAARTDVMMRSPALQVADAHAAAGGATFVYRFDWAAPGLGAAHGVDLPFTFGTDDREGWGRVVGWDRRADELARAWRACWSFFAATGNPSTPVREWPRHDPADPAVMVFSPEGPRVAPGLDASLTLT